MSLTNCTNECMSVRPPILFFHLNVQSYYVAYQSTQKFASKSVNKNIKSRKDTFSINYNIKVQLLIAIVIF